MATDSIELNNDLLIDANKLRNNNLQKRQLREAITDIIRTISDELKEAHKEGKHFIVTNIPITFTISNMVNAESQRFIYSHIISELKKKHYRVWISAQKTYCRLKITWMSPEDETEAKKQHDLIARCTDEDI